MSSTLVKTNWYDPANDSYNTKSHQKFHSDGARVLAWDLDFERNFELMAASRLDAVVTDSLQEMLNLRQEFANRHSW